MTTSVYSKRVSILLVYLGSRHECIANDRTIVVILCDQSPCNARLFYSLVLVG